MYLQITVVDTFGVTVVDRVCNLAKNGLDAAVIAHVPTALGDGVEEVTLETTVKDHVQTAILLNDLVQGGNVGVVRDQTVDVSFVVLEGALASIEPNLTETFDRADLARAGVHGAIDRAIGANSEHVLEHQGPVDDLGQVFGGIVQSGCHFCMSCVERERESEMRNEK